MGALRATAIVVGIIGLVISLAYWVEILFVGGYLFFFTPFPLDVVLLVGVLWGWLLLRFGLVLGRKEKAAISS